jgi:dihydroorotate dehydrogenase
VIVGVSLGKGAGTPLERAAEDYGELLRLFWREADYLALNLSSPNTPGLRRLQQAEALRQLLAAVGRERDRLTAATGRSTPILVKVSPDLADGELPDLVGAILEAGMDGVIATNTTLDRQGLKSGRRLEAGGVSGRPLRERSTQVVRAVRDLSGDRLPIIGVGGVCDTASAREKIEAGATLVQAFTGLVYRGPGMVRRILTGLT